METKTKEVMVTPEMAMEILKTNTRNRPLRKDIVLYYVDQMKKGLWVYNGEPIILGRDGMLMDGQHRLAAIVKSGLAQKMLIVEGISPDTMPTIDTGKIRSVADVLSINDVKNATGVGAVISTLHRLRCGNTTMYSKKTQVKFSRTEMLAEYLKNPDIIQEAHSISKRCKREIKLMESSVIGGYVAYLVIEKKHNIELVNNFFAQLHAGINIENETILTLRNKMLQNATSQTKLPFRALEQYVIVAWNAYAKGKEIKSLRISLDSPQEFI